MDDILEFLKIIFCIAIIIILMAFMTLTPVAYFDGTAKSKYIKQTQGIEMKWYEATWLDVEINEVGVDMRNNK